MKKFIEVRICLFIICILIGSDVFYQLSENIVKAIDMIFFLLMIGWLFIFVS
jgi:hypothetical protein